MRNQCLFSFSEGCKAVRHLTLALAVATLVVAIGARSTAAAVIPKPEILWRVALGHPVYATLRFRHGTVYADITQVHGPNVFAIKYGKILWQFATHGAIQMPVTVGGSQVFVASDIGGTHFMRALNRHTGHLILSGSADHSLYALARHTGTVVWKQTTGYAFVAPPAIWHTTVGVSNRGETVHAYAVNTGKPLWSFFTNEPINMAALPYRNMVFVAAGPEDRGIYGLSSRTGKQQWHVQMADYADAWHGHAGTSQK